MAEEKVVVAPVEATEEPKRAPRGDRPQRGPRKDGKKPFDRKKSFEKEGEHCFFRESLIK